MDGLFQENCIADARTFKEPVARNYIRKGHQIIEDGEYQLVAVTTDDRAKDMTKIVEGLLKNHENFDLVMIPLSTGNKNYFEWVNGQTVLPSAA